MKTILVILAVLGIIFLILDVLIWYKDKEETE